MLRLLRLIRYRFFLFAGIFPYLLGQAVALKANKALNWGYFGWGFLGVLAVVTGVELFNEYFDAKEGGDRIFLEEKPKIPEYFFILGILVFVLAFFIGLYLAFRAGWPIMAFSFLGFLAAYFYVGPPIRWAYRGLGELIIALAYGPLMVLGSYYLQSGRFALIPFFISLLCGLDIFSLAIINEVPDYYQDRLVGKKNLVVRLGKEKAIKVVFFSLVCLFSFLSGGVMLGQVPLLALVSFCFLPRLASSLFKVYRNYENPKVFLSAINAHLTTYLAISLSLSIGYLYPGG